MRVTPQLLLTCLAAAWPLAARAEGKLASVDVATGIIVIDQDGKMEAFRTQQFTEISLNGARATLDQLRPGMMASWVRSGSQTLSRLIVLGNVPGAPPPSDRTGKVPLTEPEGTNRRIKVKMHLDGVDVVKISGGRLWIEHLGAKVPSRISVNGVDWEPKWEGTISETFTAFVPPLAPFDSPEVSVKQVEGRGKTTILEPPTKENQQTLSLRIEDGYSGAGDCEVQISW